MGGKKSKPVWVPGYAPDHCGPPKVVEDYKDDPKGIQAAHRRANKYVDENPDCTFCTIGPESWLKCWKVDEVSKGKFMRVKGNVLLHLREDKLKVTNEEKKHLKADLKEGCLYF